MKLAIILLVFSSSLFHEVFSISVVTNSDSMVLGFVFKALQRLIKVEKSSSIFPSSIFEKNLVDCPIFFDMLIFVYGFKSFPLCC